MEVRPKDKQDISLAPPLPKTQRKDQSRQLKKQAVVPSVTVQNKFHVLTNPEDTTASTSKNLNQQTEAEMDINDPTEATVNREQTPNVGPTKKGAQPPPVTVIGHSNLFAMNRD